MTAVELEAYAPPSSRIRIAHGDEPPVARRAVLAPDPRRVAVDVAEERLLAVVDDLHRPARCAARASRAWICIERSSRPPNAPPTPARWIRTCSGGEAEARRDLVAVDVQPLRRDVDVDAALAVRDASPDSGPRNAWSWMPDARRRRSTTTSPSASGSPWRITHVRARRSAAGRRGSRGPSSAGRDGAAPARSRAPDRRPARAARTRRAIGGGGAARLLGVLGGDDRDRLAEVADAVDREHRLVGELEAVASSAPGTSSCVSTAWTPGMRERLGDVDRDDPRVRVRAAHGVRPRASRPRGGRSSTRTRRSTFGIASSRADASRRRVPTRSVVAVCGRSCARPPAARRRRSSRSRCSGRGCRRAPRGSRRRVGLGIARAAGRPSRRRAPACRSRTARRRPRRTPAARGAARRRSAEALDRDDLVPVGLRGEHEAGADELAVEEHRARAALALLAGVLRAGQLEPCRAASSRRLSPAQTSASRALAVDGQLDLHAQAPLERALRRARAARGGGRRRCRGRRRSGSPPRRRARGSARASSSGARDERRHGRRPSRTPRAARRARGRPRRRASRPRSPSRSAARPS